MTTPGCAAPITVGLMPYRAVGRPNGVNRYVEALATGLGRTGRVEATILDGSRRRRRLQTVARRRASASTTPTKVDVVHVPYERIRDPRAMGERPVVTVMGLGGLSGTYASAEAQRLDSAFVKAFRCVGDRAHVITPTTSTRNHVCERLEIDLDHTTVVPLGVDHSLFRPADDGSRAASSAVGSIGERPYVLHVGPVSPRKNSQVLIEAFALMRRSHGVPHALVLAGAVDPAVVDELADRHGVARHVIVIGQLTDAALAQWYRHAAAVCVPSRYEGFGLPVIEAMASGAPVVISSSPALREVAGDAAAMFEDRDDPDALAGALAEVLTCSSLAGALRARGLERSAAFTWEQCVARHVEVYERMIVER